MYCKTCGNKIDDDSLFCFFCGTKQSLTKKANIEIDIDQSLNKSTIEHPDKTLIPYRKGKKWGFCNLKKEIIIDCIYDDVDPFQYDTAIVKKNDFWGLIDTKGNLLCDIKYNIIEDFFEGYAKVYLYTKNPKRKKKYGFINLNGEQTIPLIYDDVRRFSEGLAMVEFNNKRGFIDYQGNIVIDLIYSTHATFVFNEGLCHVSIDFHNKGFINREGNVVVDFGKYKYMNSFSGGLAAVAKELPSDGNFENNIWGFIDKNGKEVIECKYQYARSFSEGLAMIRYNNKCGFINNKGMEVIPCIYEDALSFSESCAQVKSFVLGNKTVPAMSKWGYIDKSGILIIPFVQPVERNPYDEYIEKPFKQGVVALDENGKMGFRNKNNEIVIPHKYHRARSFKDNFAFVWLDENLGKSSITYIDMDGNEYFENLKSFTLDEIIYKIKDCIKSAELLPNDAGKHELIDRNYIHNCVSDIYIDSTDISNALFMMKSSKEIEYVSNNMIAIKENYK